VDGKRGTGPEKHISGKSRKKSEAHNVLQENRRLGVESTTELATRRRKKGRPGLLRFHVKKRAGTNIGRGFRKKKKKRGRPGLPQDARGKPMGAPSSQWKARGGA